MSFSAAVGQLTQPVGTGDQAINTVGFQPMAVMFTGCRSINTTAAGNFIFGQGFAVSTTSRAAVSVGQTTAIATTDVFNRQVNSACISNLNGVGIVVDVADFVSFDAGGFTINWSGTSGGGNLITSYYCFGGSDMTNASIIEFQTPAGTGAASYTGVGFMPDAIIFLSIGNATAPDSTPTAGRMMFGACDKQLGQASTSSHITDAAAASNCSKWQRIDSCINLCGASDTEVARATLTKMDADGFTLNWAVTTTSLYVWALCIKGGSAKVGSFTQPTSTGTQFINTGHLTDGATIIGCGDVANTAVDPNARICIGHTSGDAAEQSISLSDVDAADPTNCDRKFSNTEATHTINSAGTVVAGAILDSLNEHSATTPGGGFTLDWTTVDATAREMWFLSLGPVSGPKQLTAVNAGS